MGGLENGKGSPAKKNSGMCQNLAGTSGSLGSIGSSLACAVLNSCHVTRLPAVLHDHSFGGLRMCSMSPILGSVASKGFGNTSCGMPGGVVTSMIFGGGVGSKLVGMKLSGTNENGPDCHSKEPPPRKERRTGGKLSGGNVEPGPKEVLVGGSPADGLGGADGSDVVCVGGTEPEPVDVPSLL